MVKTELVVKEKTFTNKEGKEVNYTSCVAKIGGVELNFIPKPEDKKLFNYLLEKLDGGKEKGVK